MPRRQPPYLPFLQGPPDIAPGLNPIPQSRWLMPDTEADDWLLTKCILMENQPEDTVLGAIDSMAARELLCLVGEASNFTTQEEWDSPLAYAAALVSDDLCLMKANEAGEWVLDAAVVTAPTYWRLPEQIGRTLGGLHTSVPAGNPELSGRINRIFNGLAPDRVLERFNWTVQVGPARHTPYRPGAEGAHPEDLFLRVERQTLRKLPETGAVCFTIRVCMDPLMPILANCDMRETFEDSWIGADPAVRAYKGWDTLEDLVREACLQSAGAD